METANGGNFAELAFQSGSKGRNRAATWRCSVPDQTDDADGPFRMRLSLSVLEHLGLNLYSNIPAVLSEVVANSWDADASHVSISLDRDAGSVCVVDDGIGMSVADINDRFLYVGFRRREAGFSTSPNGRAVMGRKGIGKLSLFAIAETIRVESANAGTSSGFIMRAEDIRSHMAAGAGDYRPTPIPASDLEVVRGTQITLTDLRLRPTESTRSALRRRLARRFSVIGTENAFEVVIDGQSIGVTDRDFYSKIEYLWSFGDVDDTYEKLCINTKQTRRNLGPSLTMKTGESAAGWAQSMNSRAFRTRQT